MRIRKEPEIADWHTSEMASYIARRWAGRTLCTGDLKSIYGLPDNTIDEVFSILKTRGFVARTLSDGRRDATVYRLIKEGAA